ncbi:hypothetical protein BDW71DRAFT_210124 [Aspergillus fruticulosus]
MATTEAGGYLQWVELDFSHLRASATHLTLGSIESWLKILELMNLSSNALSRLQEAFTQAGLLDVLGTSFDLYGRLQDFNKCTQTWQLQATAGVVPSILLKTGEAFNIETAKETTLQYLNNVRKVYADGGVMDIRFGSGQKAEAGTATAGIYQLKKSYSAPGCYRILTIQVVLSLVID